MGKTPPPVSSEEKEGEVVEGQDQALSSTVSGPSEPESAGHEPGEPEVWTVSAVNQAVKALLDDHLPPLWISGEVANWKRAGSGHCYFSLKDESAQLRCVMWRGDASRLPMDPEEGMRVRAFGQLTLYEARGEFQLVARTLADEEGEGLWRLAFERLRKQLEGEGLLSPERKRALPRFPQTIGVVTSLSGAALHDILTVLRRRAPWLRVVLADTRVQGDGASKEIARGIHRLGRMDGMELLIVGRGGGSIEDLWAFNEEAVARAIAECPVPVVSAVGHEVDVTISDLVADLRAPTPSAAAEAVAADKEEILRYLSNAAHRLAGGLRRGVELKWRSLADGQASIRRAGARLTEGKRRDLGQLHRALIRLAGSQIPPRKARLERVREGLSRTISNSVRRHRDRLASLAGKMEALSPLSTLQRGYSVPLGRGGRVLRSVEEFEPNTRFVLRVVDGRVQCEIVDIEKERGDE